MQAIVIYSNLSLDKNKRWRTVGGLAHSRVGLGLVRPPLCPLGTGNPYSRVGWLVSCSLSLVAWSLQVLGA